MANYENSVIYKLCCTDPTVEEVYVGSTTNFRKRKNQHKECCTNVNSKKHAYPVYNYIRENGGWENWDMVQVAEVNAKDKRALHATERRYVEQLGATLNRQAPTKTRKQFSSSMVRWQQRQNCGARTRGAVLSYHTQTTQQNGART